MADLSDSAESAPGPRHVVLVGLMGSGKSTVGKRVGRLLDRPFVDADDELAERSGRTVAEWFAEDGEEGFRAAEADLVADLLGSTVPTVVAAGGGLVVTERARRLLVTADATVVYLHAEPAFLATRTKPKPHRPLLGDDIAGTMSRLYDERDAWYREVADALVEVRPAYEEPEGHPKWRLAQRVVAAVAVREGAAQSVGDAR